MHEAVIGAYLDALEQRVAKGESIESIRSVASFFVSRVDTEADKRLEGAEQAGPGRSAAGARRRSPTPRSPTRSSPSTSSAARFRALMAKGAAVQRPLWASTGTKNPKYPDTLYVDSLIGPDTVNTMPPATLEAFADHGTVDRTVDRDVEQAHRQIAAIEALGVSSTT